MFTPIIVTTLRVFALEKFNSLKNNNSEGGGGEKLNKQTEGMDIIEKIKSTKAKSAKTLRSAMKPDLS